MKLHVVDPKSLEDGKSCPANFDPPAQEVREIILRQGTDTV